MALAACAPKNDAPPAPKESPEQIVKRKIDERWKLLLKHEFDQVYAYLPPSTRAIMSQSNYSNTFTNDGTVMWQSASVESVDCAEAERCAAKVKIVYKLTVPGFAGQDFDTVINETWVKEDNDWWFFYRR